MKRFAWDSGETSNFRKTWSGTPCFCTFLKIAQHGPGERGVGGFQVWLLWCHAWLYICRYIMYGFSIQNVSWHIYIMTTRAQLSEEIRHADIGQAERWPRRILLSFAPSAAAGWHCELAIDLLTMAICHCVKVGHCRRFIYKKKNCMITV